MKATKLADTIGTKVLVSEEMKIIHSVQLSGHPLTQDLTVNYLQGEGPDRIIQTIAGDDRHNWDQSAIFNGDFQSGKLDKVELIAFAESIIDAAKPTAALRQMLIHNYESVVAGQDDRSKPRVSASSVVEHSKVRSLGN
ncbi:MAG TPA: hypothetical protein VJJ20_01150 [Candidatus Paceibacterota bacterium]